MATTTLWRYDNPTWAELDLVGYGVEALDGEVGRIVETSQEIGVRYLLVDTGPWILGKKVMLPAGIIQRVDIENQRVYVSRTKDEIKNAPEFEVRRHHDPRYRDALTVYYGRAGAGSEGTREDAPGGWTRNGNRA